MSVKAKGLGLMGEFRQFIARGNVMDMAVGVIVGGAFKAIADSLTADIIMPILGIFVSKNSFAGLTLQVGGAVITYGNFLQAILNFFIMALVVFLLVKSINSFHRKKAAAPPPPSAPPAPSAEEILLTEIRDLLKEKK
ncbi:MAG: large-conductance mechanosensitive channel protein MscL [Clostridia bacterium]|nr:large-conductance mechanosensitive channel protein MscL [Clostridia bacterium]